MGSETFRKTTESKAGETGIKQSLERNANALG